MKHGVTNYIPEHFIDGMFDLVMWGHEHECRLQPEAVELADDKRYFITQPGSSVATSLIEGEARQKQVGILHIREGKQRVEGRGTKVKRAWSHPLNENVPSSDSVFGIMVVHFSAFCSWVLPIM